MGVKVKPLSLFYCLREFISTSGAHHQLAFSNIGAYLAGFSLVSRETVSADWTEIIVLPRAFSWNHLNTYLSPINGVNLKVIAPTKMARKMVKVMMRTAFFHPSSFPMTAAVAVHGK